MSDERKRILKMLEEGMISADEAFTLLESVDKRPERMNKETVPSVDVDWNSERTYQTEGNKKQKLADFVDTAIKKIKEVDFDFNFGTPHLVRHIFQHRDVELTSLFIDIANGDIRCEPWDEKDVRLECEAQVFKARDEEEARQVFMNDTRFTTEGQRLYLSIQRKTIKVKSTLFIPRKDYEKINIRVFNGQVTSEKLDVKSLQVKTANGGIRCSHIISNDIELEAANGKVMIEHSQANELEVETLNGRINVHGSYEKTDIQSFSGNIECKLTDSNCRRAFLNAKTGGVVILVPKFMEVNGKLKSNLGHLGCYLNDMTKIDETRDVVQKELKFVASEGQEQSLQLDAETKAGSITVKHL
ncbi:DUF4097 family beta strand repeat-containing protein [Bacillus solimangrovi]|uniref:Uncharacterized protein n=1 Tax=Bacillus solimangrovi TaxID=1305675 RepID=A0A1E5LDR5_9BACI|nr:DUF4097 domain-containing protein [Bacillus solimangrovi]OEH92235.1 hypothetical protein BFG57_02915 [Bacillus solimangrovi]